jgi:YHS domain-containing protein
VNIRSSVPFRTIMVLLALSFWSGAPPALAISPVNKTLLGGKAIKGYDPVAYFANGKPVKGDKQFSFEWNGATWLFASAEHRETFRADPEKYAPQFGGYCAWAVSQGYTADIDPDAWKIVNDRLYLNYDKSVQAKWEKDMEPLIRKGEENWPGIRDK